MGNKILKNKKWIILALIMLGVIISVILIGNRNKKEENSSSEISNSNNITQEELDNAIYSALEGNTKNQYSNSKSRVCAIKVGDEYIKVSIPKKIINGKVQTITNGDSVVIPVKVNDKSTILSIVFYEYNKAKGETAGDQADSLYDSYKYDFDKKIVLEPIKQSNYAKFVYDKLTENNANNSRHIYKWIDCGKAYAKIYLQTDTIVRIEDVYKMFDGISLQSGITAEEMEKINSKEILDDEDFVTFQNMFLNNAVKASLHNNAVDAFSNSQMKQVKSLSLSISQLDDEFNEYSWDLSELEYLVNLESLHINIFVWNEGTMHVDRHIDNIAEVVQGFQAIGKLTNLKKLDVDINIRTENLGTHYVDMSFLKNLKQLEYVDWLVGNAMNSNILIKDINDFAELTNLETLKIISQERFDNGTIEGGWRYSIDDISVIGQLTNLKTLNITANVSDFSVLRDHPNLVERQVNGVNYIWD